MTDKEQEVRDWLAKPFEELHSEIKRLGYDHPAGSPVWELSVWAAWSDATGQSRNSPCMN